MDRDGCGRLLTFQVEQVLEGNAVRCRNSYQRCDCCVGRALFHPLQVLGMKANDFSRLLLAQATFFAQRAKNHAKAAPLLANRSLNARPLPDLGTTMAMSRNSMLDHSICLRRGTFELYNS